MEPRHREPAPPDAEAMARDLREMGCGRALGRYTLLRRIAAGGMAEVYVARSRGISGFEKKVAIKKILPQHSHNERFIDMLVDEAKITVSLTHPNIAQVYELGLDGEDYFIVMEYVEGRPLNRLMQRVDERGADTIPLEHAVHAVCEVAKGLEHAHRQKDQRGRALGIVHRDISPQNILISYHGDVKLIDFGIARAEGRINQTSAGVIKGKLRYLAPEIASGEEPDSRADIYCCGIVLFELLTGEAMFAPKTDFEAIEMATEGRVKSPRSRNPRVPQDLDDIVMKALVRDRTQRYQSAKDLYGDLRRFLNQNYPAFVGSELGDFMQGMFEPEMAHERRLDEAAERVASEREETSAAAYEEEEETLAARAESFAAASFEADAKRYRQLVTRLGISSDPRGGMKVAGADGGRAMSVVPADPSERPPPRGEDLKGPPTQPLKMADDEASSIEPTVRADNPFDETVRGQAPQVEGAEGAGGIIERVHAAVASGEVPAWSRDMPTNPTARRRVRPEVLAALGAGALMVLVAGAWALSAGPSAGPEEEPHQLPPIAIAEPPPATHASLVLEVTPRIPINVDVDGQRRITAALPPVELPNLTPGAQLLSVSAEGYRSQELERSFVAGERQLLELLLEAATGHIEVIGADEGELWASAGEVQGLEITNIPLDTVVELEVRRAAIRPWRTRVHVTTPDLLTVEAPAPKHLPKGTLVVNARPLSTVFVDGKRRGQTPLSLKLPPGKHRVMLKGPTGDTKSFVQTVKPGKTTTFTYRWR